VQTPAKANPQSNIQFESGSGGATPGRAWSNDLAGRSTALAQALHIALLR